MRTWMTWVRDPKTGASIIVYEMAETSGQAKILFEIKYGAANVLHLPTSA